MENANCNLRRQAMSSFTPLNGESTRRTLLAMTGGALAEVAPTHRIDGDFGYIVAPYAHKDWGFVSGLLAMWNISAHFHYAIDPTLMLTARLRPPGVRTYALRDNATVGQLYAESR
jgi:hypothetical protein